MANIIDGKALAEKLQAKLAEKTAKLKAETGQEPGLVVILVDCSRHVFIICYQCMADSTLPLA